MSVDPRSRLKRRKQMKSEFEKHLGKVSSAYLGMEDRGFLTFMITIDYDDVGTQGFGTFALCSWDKEKDRRVGTALGCDAIIKLLNLFKVDTFDKIKGRTVFALKDQDGGWSGFIRGIEIPKFDGGGRFVMKEHCLEWGIEE